MDEILSILLIYLLTLPIGYIFIKPLIDRNLNFYQPIIVFILSTSLGLTVVVPIYYLISLVKLSIITPTAFFAIPLILVFWKRNRNFKFAVWLKHCVSFHNVVPLLLLILIFLCFMNAVNYMFWPPKGDIMAIHGPLVSLIEYNSKLPTTYTPIAPEALIAYPQGMHVVIATLNTILNEYPGRAVFLFGAAIMILIPFLVYSLTYISTQSELFGIVSLSSIFYIHYRWHLESWVIGYFYNGPYACLFGLLILLVYVNIVAILIKKSFDLKKLIFGGILSSLALLLVYPSFTILVLAHLFFLLVYHRNLLFETLSKLNPMHTKFLIFFIFISLVFSLILSPNIVERFWYILGKFHESEIGGYSFFGTHAYYYAIPAFFWTKFLKISVTLGVISSIIVLRSRYFSITSFYLVTAILVLVSSVQEIYPYVSVILPRRSLMVLLLLWSPVFFTSLTSLVKKIGVDLISSIPKLARVFTANVVVLVLILVILNPYFSGEVNKRYGWFSHTANFSNDFEALQWIDENVSPHELILNDLSFSSYYLLSLSIKNSTYNCWAINYHNERAKKLLAVWKEPYDSQKIFELLQEYNVSYILLTSEWGYWNAKALDGDNKYHPKFYSPSEYSKIFDAYHFLDIVFKKGNTRVYKVNQQCKMEE